MAASSSTNLIARFDAFGARHADIIARGAGAIMSPGARAGHQPPEGRRTSRPVWPMGARWLNVQIAVRPVVGEVAPVMELERSLVQGTA